MIEVFVNGQASRYEDGVSVATLLESLGRKPLGLAVEVNLEVIPRSLHGQTLLKSGDRIEIIHMVGGG